MRQLLVVDDHPLILMAVRQILHDSEEWNVNESTTFEDACSRITEKQPDLLLLDLGLPGMFRLDALREMRQQFPDLPTIVLSGQDAAGIAREAIELGAMGFIPKTYDGDRLMAAIKFVLAGEPFIPPHLMMQSEAVDPSGPVLPAVPTVHPLELGLTNRQVTVLAELVLGRRNSEIARVLNIGEDAVRSHLQAIYRVLGVHSRLEAIIAVHRLGLRLSLFQRSPS